jgi:hypothetical protein
MEPLQMTRQLFFIDKWFVPRKKGDLLFYGGHCCLSFGVPLVEERVKAFPSDLVLF